MRCNLKEMREKCMQILEGNVFHAERTVSAKVLTQEWALWIGATVPLAA